MKRPQVFIANVVVPSDVDRDKYVSYALRTYTACVIDQYGGFIKNVPISTSFCGYSSGWFNSLEFPPNSFTLGTQVVCLNIQGHEIPIIIGCLNFKANETKLTEEYEFSFSKTYEAGEEDTAEETTVIEIHGSGIKGIIDLISSSTEEDKGKINFEAFNDSEKGEINLRTNSLKLFGTKEVEILSNEMINIIVRKVTEDEEVGQLMLERLKALLEAKEIFIGKDAEEFTAKGETLQGKIEDLIDAVKAITVPTGVGPSGTPINFAQFDAIKAKIGEILSTKVKIE